MGAKMSDINWERLAVIVAMHGEKFMGWVPEECGDPKKYLEERGQAGRPARLQDVRNLIGQASPNVDRQGNILGIQKLLLLMPVDMLNGPLPEHNIIPSSWYFPGENGDACKKQIEELLTHAVETEARLTAAAAGLHLAGSLPRQHP